MNDFFMNGKLMFKASDHKTKRCKVEKWVFLPHYDFEKIKRNPFQDHIAITACKELMYEDEHICHCIMLLDEHGNDGLLIESEGADYPRYSMFVPDALTLYEQSQITEDEQKLLDMIRDTTEQIAELAHTGKTDFYSPDMIDLDEVQELVKNAVIQRLSQRDDIRMAENTDIGVEFQPDIKVEPKQLTELKFYCPLKIVREQTALFDDEEDEDYSEDPEELSDSEALEYENDIADAIKEFQSCDEEYRGIMAYLDDRKRFGDKVYSIFPCVEKVGDTLYGVFKCQICGDLDSYEYDELLQELSGQASDGWGESFKQHCISTDEGDIYVSFYDAYGAWSLMTEDEVRAENSEDMEMSM